jgi:hypothetical protein
MASLPLSERIRRRLRRSVIAPLDARVGGAIRRSRNAAREFRPVFVAGAMGSGTTLLALSLAQRFECACVITENAHQVARDSFFHNPGVEAYATVRAYEDAIRPGSDWSVARGRHDLLRLYRSYASGPSDVAIDKGPNVHLLRAAFLARCFPDAFFVGVFRDPVATVEGFRRKWPTFARDSLEECIRFYAAIHESFLEQVSAFPGRVAWVRYESLVDRYDEVLATLAGRAGLRVARKPRRLPTRGNVEGRGIRNVSRSRIGVVADANARAHGNLSREAIARIETVLGPLHERMDALASRDLPHAPSRERASEPHPCRA